MWESNDTKKTMGCCLSVAVALVSIVLLIFMLAYSFLFMMFSGMSALFGGNNASISGDYRYPLNGTIIVTSPFSLSRVLPEVYGDNEPHTHLGTDFVAPFGTPVLAARDGIVSNTYETLTGGLTVVIDHGGGEETRYLHLSGFACSPGDSVTAGQTIAYSGNSGIWTTGPHLHFEIRINGEAVDPMTILP